MKSHKNLYFTIHPEYQGCKNNTTFPISKYFTAVPKKEKKERKKEKKKERKKERKKKKKQTMYAWLRANVTRAAKNKIKYPNY